MAAPIDHGWAWVVAFGVFVGMVIFAGSYRTYGIIFVEILTMFDANSTLSSTMYSIFMASCAVTLALYTSLIDKFSDRTLAVWSGLVYSLAFIIQYFAPNILFFCVTWGVLAGASCTMGLNICMVILAHYFQTKLSVANGIAFTGSGLGQMGLPVCITFLIDSYGFRGAMLIFGALLLNALPGMMLFRSIKKNGKIEEPENLSTNRECNNHQGVDNPTFTEENSEIVYKSSMHHQADHSNVDAGTIRKSPSNSQHSEVSIQQTSSENNTKIPTPQAVPLKVVLKLFFTNTSVVAFIIGRIFNICNMFSIVLFTTPFAVEHHFSHADIAVLLFAVGACDLVSRPIHGWLIGVVFKDVSYYSICVTYIGQVTALVCACRPSFWSIYVMALANSSFQTVNITQLNGLCVECVGRQLFAQCLSITMCLFYALQALVPILFGLAYDHLGSYQVPVIAVIVLGILANSMCFVEKRFRVRLQSTIV